MDDIQIGAACTDMPLDEACDIADRVEKQKLPKVEGKIIMTKNEKLLTVTDENEEKLRALVEKAKTRVPELFNNIIRLLQKNLKKGVYLSFYVQSL